jgi:hypothetical protein
MANATHAMPLLTKLGKDDSKARQTLYRMMQKRFGNISYPSFHVLHTMYHLMLDHGLKQGQDNSKRCCLWF